MTLHQHLNRLKKDAEAATDGPWGYTTFDDLHYKVEVLQAGDHSQHVAAIPKWKNATHIANADPQTFLALLDLAEATEAALQYLDGIEIPYVDRHRPLIALNAALDNLSSILGDEKGAANE